MSEEQHGAHRQGNDAEQEPQIIPEGLHWKILVGLAVGVAAGLVVSTVIDGTEYEARLEQVTNTVIEPFGKLFLRLIFMVVLPLVVSALIVAVATMGNVRTLGRIGLRTLFYTLVLSGIAVTLGLAAVAWLKPGERISPEKRQALQEQYTVEEASTVQAKPIHLLLLDLLPENPLQEMVGALDGSSKGNGMLAVMVFSIILGTSMSIAGKRASPLVRWFDSLFYVSMLVVGFAMRIAPYGVACLTFALTARVGPEILKTLAWYVSTVIGALAIQMFVVYPAFLALVARRSPLEFFRNASDAVVTAFATSSSNATLPVALRVAETNLQLPPSVARFVLTVGATGNQNGTALYEGVTVLFLAQIFGVELNLIQQITVVLMCILAGVGTAGVPGGSLPLVAVVCRSVGVPPEGIGIILGIDRILDMCRTTLNVTGDLAIATAVAARPLDGVSAAPEQE